MPPGAAPAHPRSLNPTARAPAAKTSLAPPADKSASPSPSTSAIPPLSAPARHSCPSSSPPAQPSSTSGSICVSVVGAESRAASSPTPTLGSLEEPGPAGELFDAKVEEEGSARHRETAEGLRHEWEGLEETLRELEREAEERAKRKDTARKKLGDVVRRVGEAVVDLEAAEEAERIRGAQAAEAVKCVAISFAARLERQETRFGRQRAKFDALDSAFKAAQTQYGASHALFREAEAKKDEYIGLLKEKTAQVELSKEDLREQISYLGADNAQRRVLEKEHYAQLNRLMDIIEDQQAVSRNLGDQRQITAGTASAADEERDALRAQLRVALDHFQILKRQFESSEKRSHDLEGAIAPLVSTNNDLVASLALYQEDSRSLQARLQTTALQLKVQNLSDDVAHWIGRRLQPDQVVDQEAHRATEAHLAALRTLKGWPDGSEVAKVSVVDPEDEDGEHRHRGGGSGSGGEDVKVGDVKQKGKGRVESSSKPQGPSKIVDVRSLVAEAGRSLVAESGNGTTSTAPLATDKHPPPSASSPTSLATSSSSSPATLSADVLKAAKVRQKVATLLDRLSFDSFDTTAASILVWVNKSSHDPNARDLRHVVTLVFAKAILDAPPSAEVCARLCRKLTNEISPDVREKSDSVVGGSLFSKMLLILAEAEYADRWLGPAKTAVNSVVDLRPAASTSTVPDDAPPPNDDLRRLGIVNFMGHLFLVGILPERIIRDCAMRLLRATDDDDINPTPDRIDIEAVCALLTIVGPRIETGDANTKEHIDFYCSCLSEIAKNPATPYYTKIMIHVLLRRRLVGWVPGRAKADELAWMRAELAQTRRAEKAKEKELAELELQRKRLVRG